MLSFYDSLCVQLVSLTVFIIYDLELEGTGLSDEEEDILWKKKLSEHGLSHEDLKLDRCEYWSVICDDGAVDDVRAIHYENGILEWRA